MSLCDDIAEAFRKKRKRNFPGKSYARCQESAEYRNALARGYLGHKHPIGSALQAVKSLRSRMTCPKELVQHRKKTCSACTHWNGVTCDLCGCSGLKPLVPLSKCPIAKWDGGWRVAVMTSPRAAYYLDQTLDSVLDAGWAAPALYADAGAPITSRCADGCRHIETAKEKLGAWRNFRRALEWVSHAEKYSMIVQDDITLAKNLRWWLERELWPADDAGLAMLVKSAAYKFPDGWCRIYPHYKGIIGAWALVFRPDVARELYESEMCTNWDTYWDHRDKQYPSFIDGLVGMWFRASRHTVYSHSPSLGQHVGDKSALGHATRGSHMRADKVMTV